MEDRQELVYGWLGLNPALLLDTPPSGDNLMVRNVRPGDDPDVMVEEARQQLAAAGSRRRRRGRGAGGDGRDGRDGLASAESSGDHPLTPVTITPLPLAPLDGLAPAELVTVAVPVHRRSRSSATAERESGDAQAPAVDSATTEATTQATTDAAAADPRRRRRRSSASV